MANRKSRAADRESRVAIRVATSLHNFPFFLLQMSQPLIHNLGSPSNAQVPPARKGVPIAYILYGFIAVAMFAVVFPSTARAGTISIDTVLSGIRRRPGSRGATLRRSKSAASYVSEASRARCLARRTKHSKRIAWISIPAFLDHLCRTLPDL